MNALSNWFSSQLVNRSMIWLKGGIEGVVALYDLILIDFHGGK